MNEQLQGRLVEILSAIQSGAKAAGDFALEQLPDIAQQYVMYGRVTAAVGFFFAMAIFLTTLFVALRYGFFNCKVVESGYAVGEWAPARIFSAAFGSFAAIISFFAMLQVGSHAALVWFAPKVWLIKELAILIK